MQRTLARLHSNCLLALRHGTTQEALDHLAILDQYVHVWVPGAYDDEWAEQGRRLHHDVAGLVQRRVLSDYLARLDKDQERSDTADYLACHNLTEVV